MLCLFRGGDMNLAEQMKQVTEFKIRKSVKDSKEIVTDEIKKMAEQHKYQFEYLFPTFFTPNDKQIVLDYLQDQGFKLTILDNEKVLLISWDV